MNYSDIAIVFMSRFRRERLVQLRTALNEVGCRTVLDVGGTAQIWDMLGGSQEVTLLNNDPQELGLGSYKAVTGDGRCLPFPDKSFDLVFSNSVIEHVGDWHDMQRLASELAQSREIILLSDAQQMVPGRAPPRHFFSPLVPSAAELLRCGALLYRVGISQ